MIPGKKFNPATETSRRPTPEKFAHLRGWTDVILQHLKLAGTDELTNINEYLEQFTDLYIDNVISQVIAQIIGKYGDGFVTIEATEDGELKVQVAAGTAVIGALAAGSEVIGNVGLEAGTEEIGKLGAGSEVIGKVGLDAGTEEIGKLAAGEALIGKVEVVGTSRTVLQAAISFASASDNQIIALVAGKKIKIANIFLTAFGEVNLTFCSNANVISGAMDFGATDEPRGIVIPLGDFPMETVSGEAFKIRASTAVQVSGYCNYYTE